MICKYELVLCHLAPPLPAMSVLPLVVNAISEDLSGSAIAGGVDGILVLELGDVVVVIDANILGCVLAIE